MVIYHLVKELLRGPHRCVGAVHGPLESSDEGHAVNPDAVRAGRGTAVQGPLLHPTLCLAG